MTFSYKHLYDPAEQHFPIGENGEWLVWLKNSHPLFVLS